MSLNIKNPEAHRLARELAELTGENMSSAVTQAIRECLQRVRQEQGKGLAARLLEIGRDCASHLAGPVRTLDHGGLLYDEKGLPK